MKSIERTTRSRKSTADVVYIYTRFFIAVVVLVPARTRRAAYNTPCEVESASDRRKHDTYARAQAVHTHTDTSLSSRSAASRRREHRVCPRVGIHIYMNVEREKKTGELGKSRERAMASLSFFHMSRVEKCMRLPV